MKFHVWFGTYILDNFHWNIVYLFLLAKTYFGYRKFTFVCSQNLLRKEESAFRKEFKNYCYVLKNSRSWI